MDPHFWRGNIELVTHLKCSLQKLLFRTFDFLCLIKTVFLTFNLARSANLPTGLYFLPSIISFFSMSQILSGSTGPIFTIFSPNERYLREFSRSGLYGPRSRGNNTFGSVRVSVRLSVGTLLFEPFDLWRYFWHEDRSWSWLAWVCRSRS